MNTPTTHNSNGNGISDSASSVAHDIVANAQKVGDASKKAARDVGSVARDSALKVKSDLDDLVSRIPTLSATELQAAKEKFLATIDSVSSTAKNYVADARVKVTEQVEVTESYIKEKPFRSVGIAAITGVLLGAFIARRR